MLKQVRKLCGRCTVCISTSEHISQPGLALHCGQGTLSSSMSAPGWAGSSMSTMTTPLGPRGSCTQALAAGCVAGRWQQ